MFRRRHIWLSGGVVIAAVWLVAGSAIWALRSQKMTADKTIVFLKEHPLRDLTDAERQQVIAEAADCVNRLSFDERQRFRNHREQRRWFEQLNDAERQQYIERTLPKGVKQTMSAFNEMPHQKRKQIVNRALVDMERFRDELDSPEAMMLLSDDTVRRVVEEGMRNCFSNATEDAKLDMQPLIEQIQRIMQGRR
jgi:hypothetical protein